MTITAPQVSNLGPAQPGPQHGHMREREPLATNATLFDAIKTLILAIIAVIVGFDFVSWTNEQVSLVVSLVAALFVVLTSVCTLNTRSKVTPVSNPRDDDGNRLEPTRS